MGLLDILNIFRRSATLSIADCLSRKVTQVRSFPANLSGKSAEGETTPLCKIERRGSDFALVPLHLDSLPTFDGDPLNEEQLLQMGASHTLDLQGHLLIIRLERKPSPFNGKFSSGDWEIVSREPPFERVLMRKDHVSAENLRRRFSPPSQFIALPSGSTCSFPLPQLVSALPKAAPPDPAAHAAARPASYGADAAATLNQDGRHTCPTCWKTFEIGEVMNIAAHDELMGDPILGDHARLRFVAERFNDLGQAIDPKGVVSLDLACPHCRGRLPPSFLSQPQIIFSLVGAPSSGKSYYLSVLLQQLPEDLIRHHHCSLQDGDPSGNTQLNEMKNRLFSATTPEDAFISKTDFEGLMYDQLHRNGKLVALPRPFVYHLRQLADPDQRLSLVFYDNAGEHFKPTVALEDSPGALHVAASHALFFLYDPTANRHFRKALRRKRDPQLRSPATDDQDTILAEMGIRIKKLKALDSHQRVSTPLAVMVGKYDVWKNLVRDQPISLPEDRPLEAEELEGNSRIVRRLLMQHCPTIVVNAESISERVTYFPVSSLGHSPKEIESGPLAGRLAPKPSRIKPILATEPALWALNHLAPQLLETPASQR